MNKILSFCFLLFLCFGSLSNSSIRGDPSPNFSMNDGKDAEISQAAKSEQSPQMLPETLEETKRTGNEEENRFFYEFVNMLFTLGLIISLLFIVSWFLKRMVNSRIQQINVSSNIKILEQRNLSTKSNVYLVDIYGKVFAIGESQNGLVRLGEFEENEIENAAGEETKS